MHDPLRECAASCPHCGADISLLLDLSAGDQSYIEDCEVCCSPMVVSYAVEDGELVGLVVESTQ